MLIALFVLSCAIIRSNAQAICTTNSQCPRGQFCLNPQNRPNEGICTVSPTTVAPVIPPYPVCTTTAQCRRDEFCLNPENLPFEGVCTPMPTTTTRTTTTTTTTRAPVTPPVYPICSTSAQCPEGQFCLNLENIPNQGICTSMTNPSNKICTTTADCPRGQICLNPTNLELHGLCINASSPGTTPSPPVYPQCTINAQCQRDEYCKTAGNGATVGICTLVPTDATTSAPVNRSCTINADCQRDEYCKTMGNGATVGICTLVPIVPAITTTSAPGNTRCTINADCQRDEYCKTMGNGATEGICTLVPIVPAITTTIVPATTAPVSRCRPGWYSFPRLGFCYKSFPGPLSFWEAQSLCANTVSTAYVAQPKTNEQMDMINYMFSFTESGPYWIGLRKGFGSSLSQGWVWPGITNDVFTPPTPATYTNWRPSQPDGCCGSPVTCVLANYVASSGQWDDAGCGQSWSSTGVMCQYSVDAPGQALNNTMF